MACADAPQHAVRHDVLGVLEVLRVLYRACVYALKRTHADVL